MRMIRLLALITVVAVPLTADAARKPTTAKASYEQAQARERTLARRGLDAAPVSQVRSLIAVYADVVHRFPRSGYADNALFDAARLASALYGRTRDVDDRQRARAVVTASAQRLSAEQPRQGRPRAAEAVRSASRWQQGRPAEAVAGASRETGGLAGAESGQRRTRPGAARITGRACGRGGDTAARRTHGRHGYRGSRLARARRHGQAGIAAPKVRLVDIRRAILPEVVRVTLELDGEVAYQSRRQNAPRSSSSSSTRRSRRHPSATACSSSMTMSCDASG